MVANPEWKAVRSVHLQGGCRAFNGLNNSVELRPIASNGKTAAIATPTYPALFGILEQAGFLVIGTDFYFGPEQTDGRRLPEWRSYNVVPDRFNRASTKRINSRSSRTRRLKTRMASYGT
jgi:hypothetical protein